MEQKFSQKLKKRIIAYFLNNHKEVITDQQAERYLSSMARFCSVFVDKKKEPETPF